MVLFVALHLTTSSFAQKSLVQRSKNAPFWVSTNVERLSNYLTAPYESDSLKARAIYEWMSNHIRYDVHKKRKQYKSNRLLKRRKGICSHYSQLYSDLCNSAGLQVMKVEGYSRSIEMYPNEKHYWSTHAWNAIKLNDKWFFVDMTWGSGFIVYNVPSLYNWFIPKKWRFGRARFMQASNDQYFCTPIADFLCNHIPISSQMIWGLDSLPDYNTLQARYNINAKCRINQAEFDKLYVKEEVVRNLDLIESVETLNPLNDEFAYRAHIQKVKQLMEFKKATSKKENQQIIGINDELMEHLKIVKSKGGAYKRDVYTNTKEQQRGNKLHFKKIERNARGIRGYFKGVLFRSRKDLWSLRILNMSYRTRNESIKILSNRKFQEISSPKSQSQKQKSRSKYLQKSIHKSQKSMKEYFDRINQKDSAFDSLLIDLRRGLLQEMETMELLNVLCANRTYLNQNAYQLPFFEQNLVITDSVKKHFYHMNKLQRVNFKKSRRWSAQKYRIYKKAYRTNINNIKKIHKLKAVDSDENKSRQLFKTANENYQKLQAVKYSFRTWSVSMTREKLNHLKVLMPYYRLSYENHLFEQDIERKRYKREGRRIVDHHKHYTNTILHNIRWVNRQLLKLKEQNRKLRIKEKESSQIDNSLIVYK